MQYNVISGWLGQWEIVINDHQGNIIERTGIKPNLIMDSGLNMLRDLISGAITDGEIKYVGLGSGTTQPAVSQSRLITERWRKQTTYQGNDPTPGKLYTELYVSDFEANNFKTEEIGWFCGTKATGTMNTGIMIARVLFSRQKNNLESWTIRRTDTFMRG